MPLLEPDALRHATQLISSGQLEQAEGLLNKLLNQEPQNDEVLVLKGLCTHGLRGAQAALPFFERAVEVNDNSFSAHYYCGRMLANLGQADQAREALAQALALNPNFVEARTILGTLSMQQGKLERATSELRTALRADQDYVPALSALARALALQGELEEAEQLAGRAVRLKPDNAAAQDAMAFVFVNQGRFDFAEQCLRNALKIQPDNAELNSGMANLLMRRRRDREALPYFSKALAQNFGGARTALNMSISLARSGDRQQAWQLLEQAHSRWPEDQDLRLALAEYRIRAGRAEAAQELIAAMDAQRFDVRLVQVRINQALGLTDAALAVLDQAIASALEDEARYARLLKVDICSQHDRLTQAQQAIEPLLKVTPPDSEAVQTWVRACRRLKRADLALSPVQRLLKEAESSETEQAAVDRARLHQLLAELHERLQQPEQALKHLGRTSWRPAPMADILQQQKESGVLQQWFEYQQTKVDLQAPDDGLPPPIIVAGWPGSGRELILSALLEASEQLLLLDSSTDEARRQALGLPAAGPDRVLGQHESVMHTARKRYMRGLDRDQLPKPVLDTAWYEMSAIPVLATAFPGLIVIWPEFDARDLELYFRFSGYQDVPTLAEQLAEELKLAGQFSQQLPVRVISIHRRDLFVAPGQVIAKLCNRLGIRPVPAMQARLEFTRSNGNLLPDERWQAYRPLFKTAAAT